MRRPLTPSDAARLRLESPETPMTITAVLLLERNLTVEALRTVAEARLLRLPRFRMRVRALPYPVWEDDPGLDVGRHVLALPPSGGSVAEAASALASEPLPEDRPRWSIHLLDDPSGASALIARVHHCIGDGATLLRALLALTDEGRTASGHRAPPRLHPVLAGRELLDLVRPRSPRLLLFDGALGRRKRIAWPRAASLEAVHAAARAAGATVADLLFAGLSGALRRWLQGRGATVDDAAVSALVTVQLPPRSGDRDGNHYGSMIVPLPVGVPEPADRVWAVHAALASAKISGAAQLSSWLVAASSLLPRPVARALAGSAHAASLSLSDLVGPEGPVAIGGVHVRRIVASIPVLGRIPLSACFLGYAGRVDLGITADERVLPDVGAIATAVEEEWAARGWLAARD